VRLLEVRIKAYRSVVDSVLNLDNLTGLTGVEGRTNTGGASSNGAGKSAFFMDAPSWCLFGKPVQEFDAADDVINRELGTADVEVDVQLASGRTITVSRKRTVRGEKLVVSGVSGGTKKGTQEALEKILGFDFDLWTRSVAFGGNLSSFCGMSDADKKRVLERFLGLEQYGRAKDAANAKAREAKTKRAEAMSALVSADESLESINESLTALRAEAEGRESRWRREYNRAFMDFQDSVDESLPLYDRLRELDAKAADEDASYAAAVKKHVRVGEHYEEEFDKAQKAAAVAQSKVDRIEEKIEDCRERLSDLANKEHPEDCPTCGQPWPQEDDALGHLITAEKDALRKLEADLQQAQHNLERAEHEERDRKVRRNTHRNNAPSPGQTRATWKRVLREVEDMEAEAAQHLAAVNALRSQRDDDPYTPQIASLEKQLSVVTQRREFAAKEYASADEEYKIYSYWVDGFGRTGIPSYLIDSSIPFLNEEVRKISSVLTDGSMDIYFDPSVEGGRGSRGGQSLGVVVDNTAGGAGFKSQSKGEKARVDVCVLLSLRALMATRLTFGFDQLFIDEVFDGLDNEGIERLVGLLRAVFPDTSIFIITHNDSLKGLMDRTILVQKNGRQSRLVVKN